MASFGMKTRKRYRLLNMFLTLAGFALTVIMFTGVSLFLLVHSMDKQENISNMAARSSRHKHVFPGDIWLDEDSDEGEENFNLSDLFLSMNDKPNVTLTTTVTTAPNTVKSESRFKKHTHSLDNISLRNTSNAEVKPELLPKSRKRRHRPKSVRRSTPRPDSQRRGGSDSRLLSDDRSKPVEPGIPERRIPEMKPDSQRQVPMDYRQLSDDRSKPVEPGIPERRIPEPKPDSQRQVPMDPRLLSDDHSKPVEPGIPERRIPEPKPDSQRQVPMDSLRSSYDRSNPEVDRRFSDFQPKSNRQDSSHLSSDHQSPEDPKRDVLVAKNLNATQRKATPQQIVKYPSSDHANLDIRSAQNSPSKFNSSSISYRQAQGVDQHVLDSQSQPDNLMPNPLHPDPKYVVGKGAPNSKTHSRQDPEQPPNAPSEKRRSLLIFGDDRSGTTFVTKMFAEDPQMFTIYEPLWVTKEWGKQQRIPATMTVDLVNALLSCEFTRSNAGRGFLYHTKQSWVQSSAFPKNIFRTDAFAALKKSGNKYWPDLARVPHFAETVCLNKFKHSVVKVGQVRVPGENISLFIPRVFHENPDTDIRVIHIVRDPRGSINSRIRNGWVSDFTFTGFPMYASKMCGKIAANIEFGRRLKAGLFSDRYMEVTYREIATMPVLTAKKIYSFAGFEMPDSLIDWIIESTNPDDATLERALYNPFSHVRDSSKNVVKWRSESPIRRVRVIEERCKNLLDLLGLDSVADEMEILCS